MKQVLQGRSKRFGYDGWCLMVTGAAKPMEWTMCTTRAEVRQLKKEQELWMRKDIEIVKVKVIVEVVA